MASKCVENDVDVDALIQSPMKCVNGIMVAHGICFVEYPDTLQSCPNENGYGRVFPPSCLVHLGAFIVVWVVASLLHQNNSVFTVNDLPPRFVLVFRFNNGGSNGVRLPKVS